jgi:formylglycine-generating enzyme required for sulfatase activity
MKSEIRNPKSKIPNIERNAPALSSFLARFSNLFQISKLVFRILLLAVAAGCNNGSKPAVNVVTPKIITTKSGIEMVVIPAGSFEMGSKTGRADEKPVHTVWLDSFLMDKTEVTQAEWEKLGNIEAFSNPSNFKGSDLPVNQVKWGAAANFCNARSKLEGLKPCYNDEIVCDFDADGYRLPTEAEWEYACRAGTTADYSFGNDARKLGDVGWFADNAGKTTHPVGQKKPNPWGLLDMHGNVAEWCHDVYDKDYYSSGAGRNPRGPAEGKQYVLRGGSWKSVAEGLRSSYRLGENPGFADACLAPDAIGFRCVRKVPPDGANKQ